MAEFNRQVEDAGLENVYMSSSCALVSQTFFTRWKCVAIVFKGTPEMDESQKKIKSCIFPWKQKFFLLFSSDFQLVPPLLSGFISSYRASRYAVLPQGHLPKTWQWVKFLQIFSTLHADAWQLSNWQGCHTSAGARTDEENPINQISDSSFTFRVTLFFICPFKGDGTWAPVTGSGKIVRDK